MAVIAPFIFWQLLDNNGDPLNGGKVETYEAGTSTPKRTFIDQDETAENANPVVLDSNGRANIWLDDGVYKFVLRDSADNLIATVDDVSGVTTGDAAAYEVSTNTNIVSSYNQGRIFASGTINLSLLAADEAGDGFEIYVKNVGTGVITIDPDAAETIDGNATATVSPGSWVIVYCDGTQWLTFSSEFVTDLRALTSSDGIVLKNSAGSTVATFGASSSDDVTFADDITVTGNISGATVSGDMIASQAEAEAGTATDVVMTPERTSQAIDALAIPTSGTVQNTTSGTAFDFSSIPSNASKITFMVSAVSLSGSDDLLIQIGDAGGVETTGYVSQSVQIDGAPNATSYTTGFGVILSSAGFSVSGVITLSRIDAATNEWVAGGVLTRDDSGVAVSVGGRKALSDVLTQVRLTRDGTNTFDAGKVNILYE